MSATSGIVVQPQEVDILHPFATTVDWSECRHVPVSLGPHIQALHLEDKMYAYAGGSLSNKRNSARIYIYSPSADTWSVKDAPVYGFILVAYKSQLLLVGGKEYVSERADRQFKNKIFSTSVSEEEVGLFKEFLPHIPRIKYKGLSAVSHENYLFVADGTLGDVDVYDGHQWASATPIPKEMTHRNMKSAIVDGRWYLTGGGNQEARVYYVPIESLVASCQLSGISQSSSIWKSLPDTPLENCKLACFGRRLIAIGKAASYSIYAYSFSTQLWTHVFDLPFCGYSFYSFTIVVFPSGEMIIADASKNVIKATLTMTSSGSESLITMKALHLLEATGIPLISRLNIYTEQIRNVLNISQESGDPNADALLECWLSDPKEISPTWKNFLQIIRQLGLEDLAEQIETYLSTAEVGVKDSGSHIAEGYGDIDPKDAVIFRLKQEIATLREEKESVIFALEERNMELKLENQEKELAIFSLKERNMELKLENDQFRSKLQTKKEFKGDLEKQPLVKTEREEKPPVLISVKTEREEKPLALVPWTSRQAVQPTDLDAWDLPGVDVCKEMTVVVYSSSSQQITLEDYGLKLYIHEGSLPAGMEQCTINIKVSLAGQYEFPENFHLVSAIFWFRCNGVSRFSRPIMVEIQHCAMSDRACPFHLNFVRAVCTQKHLPYTFQLLGGDFTSYSSYGITEVYSFSGLGVIQEGSDNREYCSQLYYLGQSNASSKIHFVVTWNTKAHLMVVREEYEREGAKRGPHQLIEFESEAIKLDIPKEGIICDNGWKIFPLVSPTVKKTQVDNFEEGKVTPCCQLKAELSTRKKKIPILNYQLFLQGAKEPYNYFTLELPVHDEGPPPSKRQRSGDQSPGSTTLGRGLDTKLGFELHTEVCGFLKVLNKEQILSVGGALRLAYFNLTQMKDLPGEMVAAWFRKEDYVEEEPTWRILVEALKRVGQTGVAKKIEEEKTS